MIIYKISWKSYIADLYVPEEKKGKVVILLPGLPKSSNIEKIVGTFLRSGCVVLYPNFSGTFDSGGLFSGIQSINDVQEFIKWAHQTNVIELYFNKKINLGSNNKIILAGMSFGGIIALLSCNNKIDKLLLLSPALIFNQSEVSQIINFDFRGQMDSLISLLKKAFPYSYRINSIDSLEQFLYGNLNEQSRENIQKKLKNLKLPVLYIHGKMDTSIPWNISREIKKSVKNKMIKWKFIKVGHSTSSYSKTAINLISKFIENDND